MFFTSTDTVIACDKILVLEVRRAAEDKYNYSKNEKTFSGNFYESG